MLIISLPRLDTFTAEMIICGGQPENLSGFCARKCLICVQLLYTY